MTDYPYLDHYRRVRAAQRATQTWLVVLLTPGYGAGRRFVVEATGQDDAIVKAFKLSKASEAEVTVCSILC